MLVNENGLAAALVGLGDAVARVPAKDLLYIRGYIAAPMRLYRIFRPQAL